uniref:STI1 domain-containing protein n=1 Tax=Globisporangium ultimum (strain ATCC 200006 / CBS 805.95 / DAOM BR144) TaxID=431595 RepID=K3WAR9_GLOUD
MAMDAATQAAALFHALAWIDNKKKDDAVDTENVEVGVQCLSEAFKLNVHDEQQKRTYALSGSATFEDIFAAGLKALNIEIGAASPLDSVDQDPVVLKNPDLWKKWIAKLEEKNFFNGLPAGSDEHTARLKKALAKFKEKFGDVKKPAPTAPSMSKEEKEAKAEEAKGKGNLALSAGDYKQAAVHYEEALKLSPAGPNSHIYHSNLAAALTYLGKYDEVIDHSEKSIALKPAYVKAYSRMGHAYVQLKDFDGAIDAFRRGLEVDSTNAACKDGLAEAERKRRQVQTTAAPAAPAGGAAAGDMPDLSGLASMLGGGGGGGGLADLMSNPALQQMASSMMQNPQMMQMAQNMMQNPEMLSSMMNNLGGMGGGASPGAGGGAGGMPDMSRLMNSPELMAARSDPDLQDFFRDVDSEGPSAAMRHMSNPKVSQLLQNVMSRMQ